MTNSPDEISRKYLKFNGRGWPLFKLIIANFFLTLITLGIYIFWARARYHRFFYYHTEFDGGNFDFHATGKELFILFLKSILIITPSLGAMGGLGYFLYIKGVPLFYIAGGNGGLLFMALLALIPLAVYEVRKFIIDRTSWNLKRFSFNAPIKTIYLIYLKGFFFSLITFGIYSFWFQVNLKKYLINHTSFNSKYFSYRGKGKDIFFMALLAMLLTPLTFGFYIFWFIAKLERYDWSHTFYNNYRLNSTITGGGLLKNIFISFFQTLLTAGIGFSWALIRQKKYYLQSLCLTDEIITEEDIRETELEHDTLRPAASSPLSPKESPIKNKISRSPGTSYDFQKEIEKTKRLLRKRKVKTDNSFSEDYGDFFD